MISISELREFPLLTDLDDKELEQLSQRLRSRKATKGTYIMHEDDPGANLMFVSSGKVKISLVSDEGKEVVITHFGAGEFFGEIALLTGEPRSADVVAVESSVLYVLTQEDFNNHILENTGLSRALLQELAIRLKDSSEKIGDLVLFDVYRRVARTLKNIAEEKEVDGDTIHVIAKRPTHQELAAMVGTSREMVTRALKGLEEDGCIAAEGKEIKIFRLPR